MQKHSMFIQNEGGRQIDYYLAADVDEVLKRQASAALAGMNAAKAISSAQVQQAHRLRAESSPEALESERQANAILTSRIDKLEKGLRDLCRAYVNLMESGRERIIFLGGDCDPVDVMERGDPYLRQARELMER